MEPGRERGGQNGGPCMLGHLLSWAASSSTFALGAWAGSRSSGCDCRCEFAGLLEPNQAVLGLLQRQLDRCGPEQLVRAAPEPCPTSTVGGSCWLLAFALGFVGCAVGFLAGRRSLTSSSSSSLALSPEPVARRGPATPAALKDGSEGARRA